MAITTMGECRDGAYDTPALGQPRGKVVDFGLCRRLGLLLRGSMSPRNQLVRGMRFTNHPVIALASVIVLRFERYNI